MKRDYLFLIHGLYKMKAIVITKERSENESVNIF